MNEPDPPTPRRSVTAPPADPWFAETLRRVGAGRVVFDRFRLQRELGTGGMAVVWLADDERLKEPVALKFLSPQLADDDEAIADLLKEITRGRKLTHHGVVRLHDMHHDAGAQQIAISMEYVDGRTLGDEKSRQPDRCFDVDGPLLGWTASLCDALTYVHEQAKIVHRDLKPRNVLLASSGELKIADFGISATLSSTQSRMTQHLTTAGTPAYMSPQQASGRPPSVADDVYALGATLYELITSKPPFHSGGAVAILHQLKTEVPPSMSARRAEFGIAGRAPIPQSWEETVAVCLAKEPAGRPRSIADVHQALLRGLNTIRLESFAAAVGPDAPTVRATVRQEDTVPSPPGPALPVAKPAAPVSREPAPGLTREAPASRPAAPAEPARTWKPLLVTLLACIAVGLIVWQLARRPAAAPLPAVSQQEALRTAEATRILERARALLGRESLNQLQAMHAVDLCDDVVSIDPDFRDVQDLRKKAEAIQAALGLEGSAEATPEEIRARWTAISKLPPTGRLPIVEARLAPPKPSPETLSSDKKITELRARIDRARKALAGRLGDSEYRLAVAREESLALVLEAGALQDSATAEKARELDRAIDEQQSMVEEQFAAARPRLDQLLASFQDVIAKAATPDWESKATTLKTQIEQSLKGFDFHQNDPAYSGLVSRIADGRREVERRKAAATPKPTPTVALIPAATPIPRPTVAMIATPTPRPAPTPTPMLAKAAAETGAQSYKGAVGPYTVAFDLTFTPDGRVSGRYTIWGRNVTRLRLEGRVTGNDMDLDEYTLDGSTRGKLTAHLKLKLTRTATEVRWSGTMQNVNTDSSKYSVAISRGK